MESKVIFPKMISTGLSCVKFVNENGIVLSFAGDDSCGVHKAENKRMSVAVFNEKEEYVEDDRPFYGEADEFLRLLAAHLGYEVVKK